jgi:hypothetical protein
MRKTSEALEQRARQRAAAHVQLDGKQRVEIDKLKDTHRSELAAARAGKFDGGSAAPAAQHHPINHAHEKELAKAAERHQAARMALEADQGKSRAATGRYDHPNTNRKIEDHHANQRRELADRHESELRAIDGRHARHAELSQHAQDRQAQERRALEGRHAQESRNLA